MVIAIKTDENSRFYWMSVRHYRLFSHSLCENVPVSNFENGLNRYFYSSYVPEKRVEFHSELTFRNVYLLVSGYLASIFTQSEIEACFHIKWPGKDMKIRPNSKGSCKSAWRWPSVLQAAVNLTEGLKVFKIITVCQEILRTGGGAQTPFQNSGW